ncbi:MAG: endonuclease/exonuclease/phosphatase family protein [Clostridia bacterium]|nr:endonuclease/exonuclease/phosphatase family protein [Clostridia bacterium]
MKLKVISFNIRSIDDPNGNSIAERAPRLKSVVDAIDPDIIGFQENTPKWEPFLNRDYGDKYVIFNKYRTLTHWPESAPLLWKKDLFDEEKRGWFWYSETPDEESGNWDTLGHKRMCCWVVLRDRKQGVRFAFMNTHFGFGEENQLKSAKLIKERADALGELPLFLTGDFNSGVETPAYRFLSETFTDVNAVTARDFSRTFHGYQDEGGEHIDYCFVNSLVKPLSLRTITEKPGGMYPSDHFGLEIDLEL